MARGGAVAAAVAVAGGVDFELKEWHCVVVVVVYGLAGIIELGVVKRGMWGRMSAWEIEAVWR